MLSATEFMISCTENRLKGYNLGQLVFGHDMLFPIKHTYDWELIHQCKQEQNNKDDTHKNSKIVDHDYKVIDKVMLNDKSA